jgi:multiple sugar transport system permease protein
MVLQSSRQQRVGRATGRNVVLFICMGVVALLLVSPVLWLLSASVQNQAEIFQSPFNWFPSHLLWQNYVDAWVIGDLQSAFWNSIAVTLIYVPVHVFVSTLTGYVFAKFTFRGKNALFLFILLTLLIPQETTYFTVYGIVRDLNLFDTPLAVALPFFCSAFGIFLMRQVAISIPNELLEAAKLDGCSNWRCFISVALPLLEPGMVALAILALTFIWSEFTWSHFVLSTPGSQTLPVALYLLNTAAGDINHVIGYPVLLAASVIAIAPVILLFLFFQRCFIESVSRVGIRG